MAKSERLKKLELELTDLEQWIKLGLVPKKDEQKHNEEIKTIKIKIEEEKDRLNFLKENGELEDYVTPKRAPRASTYSEGQTIPDIDMANDTSSTLTETGLDLRTDSSETESDTVIEEKNEETEMVTTYDDEDDNPFSDKNRWRRGIADPEADEW